MRPGARHPYDEVPYPSYSHTRSHPDHLAAVATLFGLAPAPVPNCRVLELGCASGGNLLPMACGLRDATFVGIDASGRQIAAGNRVIEALGLTNVRLLQMDILAAPDSLGGFDYIVAHGLYSWVSKRARDGLLDLCRRLLAPNGLVYVSYNVLPGWHPLIMAREAMLYHTRGATDPEERSARAKDLIGFLSEAARPRDGAHARFLVGYRDHLAQREGEGIGTIDAAFLHDELEEVNHPVYFHQFAAHASRHGLQYVADAELPTAMTSRFPDDVATRLLEFAHDLVELEQYMDFVSNRMFRMSILCPAGIDIVRSLRCERAMHLAFAARIRPSTSTPDVRGRSVETFQAADGAEFRTDHPVTKAALLHLARHQPAAVWFADLLEHSLAEVYGTAIPDPSGRSQDAQLLAANLLQALTYSLQLVEPHAQPPRLAVAASTRPEASRYARLQATDTDTVTNLRHERVTLDEVSRFLLPQLDGTRDRFALTTILVDVVDGGLLRLPWNTDVEQAVDSSLAWLGRAALLEVQ